MRKLWFVIVAVLGLMLYVVYTVFDPLPRLFVGFVGLALKTAVYNRVYYEHVDGVVLSKRRGEAPSRHLRQPLLAEVEYADADGGRRVGTTSIFTEKEFLALEPGQPIALYVCRNAPEIVLSKPFGLKNCGRDTAGS